jgi:predicted amidohydrolase
MPRKVWIVTTSWGAPGGRTAAQNRETALALLDEAAAFHPDLVCLPEEVQMIGVAREARAALAEPVPGPLFDALAERARRHNTYVVAGLGERRDGAWYNTAVLIDRQGRLAGRYDKRCPTDYELRDGVVPGGALPVFETDFGRLGVQICYDIGWPDAWDALGRAGAELVVWPSAYDGGFPLQAYAWRNGYHVVSSVWTHFGRVVDVAGRVLASTTRLDRLVATEIDLERTLFHADYNLAKLPQVRARLGRAVRVEHYADEGYFTLESDDPAWPVARIAREFGLETFRDYHARATRLQDEARRRVGATRSDGADGLPVRSSSRPRRRSRAAVAWSGAKNA